MRKLLWIVAAAASALGVGQALPRIKIKIDDQSASIGPVYLNLNTYNLPFKATVKATLGDKANLTLSRDGKTATIEFDGKPVVSISLDDDNPVEARILDAEGAVIQSFTVDQSPRVEKINGQPTLMVTLDGLGQILGVASDFDDEELDLYTPSFWCKKLGMPDDAAQDRTVKNLAMIPDIGVTPPAENFLVTVRGRMDGYTQMYKFEADKPVVLIGKSRATGERISTPNLDFGELPLSDRCSPKLVAVAETMRTPGHGKFGFYAAIFTRKPFDGKDPLAAIKSGQLKDGEWGVAGVRQLTTETPILYEPYKVKSGDTIESICNPLHLSPGIIRSINGLNEGEQPTSGRMLIVITKFNNKVIDRQLTPEFHVVDLYEVKPNDTVERICAAWKVPKPIFYQGNPEITPGMELEPGTLLSKVMVVPKDAPPPPSGTPAIENVSGTRLTKGAVALRKMSAPDSETVVMIPAKSAIVISARLPASGQLCVSYRDHVGYVSENDVQNANTLVRATYAYLTGKRYGGSPSKWKDEALKYLGTPYKWGGANLHSGIDCSHFVEAIYKKVNEPVPSPPVHIMERFGELVGFKSGPCEVGGKAHNFPIGDPFSRLQPGDRIIMQNRPEGKNKSDHHTGLYLGRIDLPNGKHIEHAMVDACGSTGVTVHDMDHTYTAIYKYALHGNSQSPWLGADFGKVAVKATPKKKVGAR